LASNTVARFPNLLFKAKSVHHAYVTRGIPNFHLEAQLSFRFQKHRAWREK